MHIVILTAGKDDAISIQHLHHHAANHAAGHSRHVNLLVMDARDMSEKCLNAATAKIAEIRKLHGLGHGVLLCSKPTMPVLVASIRCGLRDVITQYLSAPHLLKILRSASPGLTRRDYIESVRFLRTFNAFSTGDGEAGALARRSAELTHLSESLAEKEKELALEKDRIVRLDQDIRERTRRLDRQIARMQTNADAPVSSSNPPIGLSELEAMSRRLDKRAAELDVREKLLNEMQTLLLSTPQAATINKHLVPPANGLIG